MCMCTAPPCSSIPPDHRPHTPAPQNRRQQHADTKEYFGGCQHPIKEQQGHISCKFDLKAAPLDTPLKFKAWISPSGAWVGLGSIRGFGFIHSID